MRNVLKTIFGVKTRKEVVITKDVKWFPVKEEKNLVLLEKRRKVLVDGKESWMVCTSEGNPIRRWNSKEKKV